MIAKRCIFLDGIATSYLDVGSGEALVALHGIPTSSALFEPLLPFLDQYRVIAPDLLGQGETGAPTTGRLGFLAYSRHLGLFMDKIPPPTFHLLIHDFGGVLGLNWACDHQERVRSVVILSTTVSWSFRVGVLIYAANILLGDRLIRWAVSATLKRSNRPEAELIDQWAHPWSRRRILRGMDHFSPGHLKRLRSKLRNIRVPVLVIWGKEDNVFGLAHALRIVKELPRSRLVTIPRCGHWSPVDAPEEVARHIVEFLGSADCNRVAGENRLGCA
jgi:haloalkane dehalogenase